MSSRGDPTRTWLLFLVLLWGGIVAILLMLEALTFQPLVTLLSPLLAPVARFFQWLVYLFEHRPPPVLVRKLGTIPHGRPDPLPQQQAVPPLGLAVLIIVLTLLLLVAIVALLKWYLARQSDPDEVREGVLVRSVLRARRQANRKNRGTHFVLEPLDPSSARARYRQFLQFMSHSEDDVELLPSETPSEYQQRLLLSQEKRFADETQKDDIPSSSSILSELTQAYIHERYRGMQTSHTQKVYLDMWLPRLLQRFMGSKARRISRQRKHRGTLKTEKK